MTQEFDTAAYRYQKDLPDAIDALMADLRQAAWSALKYRGADLSRLIGMEFYYRSVNDPGLQAAYARYCLGERSEALAHDSSLSEVAGWVYPQLVGARRARRSLTSTMTMLWQRGVGTLMSRATRRRSHAEGLISDRDSKARPVAMLALSLRFYRYLLPIRHRLGGPVCWLVPDLAPWSQEISASGDDVLHVRDSIGNAPLGAIPKPLQNWKSTLQRFDAYLEALRAVAPSVVVVVEGNHLEDEIAARAAESAGIKSLCVQQGWSPFVHSGFRHMRFDAFCVWGSEFAKMLQPYNPRQRFVVSGSHMIEPLARKANPDAGGISFFLQRDHLVISERNWRLMLEFIDWCALKWPEREILVREHPSIPFSSEDFSTIRSRPNVVFCPASAVSLQEVLDRSQVSVAIFSTTLIESLARHVVPVVVNVTGAPRYFPDLAGLGVAVESHDYEEARTMIAGLLGGRVDPLVSRIPQVLGRFFAAPCEASLASISGLARQMEADQ